MRVSVIVPAYNEEAYIEKCLEGITSQEEKPDEIIVVNNNSTDKTVAIAKKFPVRIVNEKEQGMIQARNRGFNEAQYDIIARTDADTIVSPDWIKKIKENFSDEKLVGLSGPSYFYGLNHYFAEKGPLQTLKSYFHLLNRILGHDIMYGPNMALRKDAWDKIKNEVCLKGDEVHEDLDLSLHLSQVGKMKMDYSLMVATSFRRFKKLLPYFDYPYRVVKSVRKHKPFKIKVYSSNLVRKFVSKAFINK